MKLRQHLRVPIRCPVELSGEDFFCEATVINLSLGGWTVETTQAVQTGINLTLRAILPDGGKPIVVKRVTVQWSREGTVGLKTVDIEEEEKERLNRFLLNYVNRSSIKFPSSAAKSRS